MNEDTQAGNHHPDNPHPSPLPTGEGVVICARCGKKLGDLIVVGELEMLKIGVMIILRSAHGVCAGCGEEFHWNVSDRLMMRIVERARNRLPK